MKIAIVHSYYSSVTPSGENVAVDGQIRALRARGHEVVPITVRTDTLSKSATYKLRAAVNVISGSGFDPTPSLLDANPDVIHVHNLFPNISSAWLKKTEIPVVTTLHNFRPLCASGTLSRNGMPCTDCFTKTTVQAVIHKCYRDSSVATLPLAIATAKGPLADARINHSARLIVLSERAAQTFISQGVPADRLEILPNFADSEDKLLSGPGEAWVYIGRLTAEKGILTLLRGWPRDIELQIVGEGPLSQEVADICDKLPNVTFRGAVPHSEVSSILASSKGLVFPSEWPEGAPMVYVEALAVGRPVVARRGNSVADDVAIHSTGMVYDSDEELATAVRTITNNWLSHQAKAASRYRTAYTATAWVDRVEEIYKKIIN